MKTDSKIISTQKVGAKIAKIRKGKTVVVATGTFDLLHVGHLLFLDFAKRQGDILVVGIGSDRTVKMYKGDTRPVVTEDLRMRLLAGLEVVDFVVCMDEDPIDKIGGRNFFKSVRPDKWVVPYQDHNPAGVVKFAKELKTKLVHFPRIAVQIKNKPLSTTNIVAAITKKSRFKRA